MLIEEIMPINYYNQLIGILVDTTILKILIKSVMPKLSLIIENNKDYDGNFIGDIFINKILVNLFISNNIDKNISLLILDYLFIKGNKVVFNAFLSIYKYLHDFIVKGEKCIENYSKIINEDLKNLKIDNEDFLFNLFFVYEKSISKINIDEYRKTLTEKISQSIEEKNIDFIKSKVKLTYSKELYEKQFDKFSKCHKEWPYCLMDSYFENVTRVVEILTFSKRELNYIDDYFFMKKTEKKEDENNIDKYEEKIDYNILLERRPHFCNEIQQEMNLEHKEKEKEKEKELNKIKNEENEIKENEDEINLEENKGEINEKIEFIKKVFTQNDFLNASKIIEDEIIEDIKNPENNDQ